MLANDDFGLIIVLGTELQISDQNLSLYFQIPSSFDQDIEYLLQSDIGGLVSVPEKDRPQPCFVFNKQ